jgi:DNA-binding MarR family transcriptional regulator
MPSQMTLRPVDIPVVLRLAEVPDATFQVLAENLGISSSTAHGAVERLTAAGLVYPHERRVNRRNLLEFLEHGIRYAFPSRPRGRAKGVPTAHAAPPLASEIVSDEALVWPDPSGPAFGEVVDPLYDGAVKLPSRCPSLYEMLTLVDAVRVGRARERNLATEKLRSRLQPEAAAAEDE